MTISGAMGSGDVAMSEGPKKGRGANDDEGDKQEDGSRYVDFHVACI